jgi:flagellar motility protein MotE (MotC chaperone)
MSTRFTLLTATIACVALLSAASVFAQTAPVAAPKTAPQTPRVDTRQANEAQRINQGIHNGQLTARETHRLDKQQQRIAVAEANAKADGKVTGQERKRLHKMQNNASKDIYQQKHDAQTAVPAGK